MDAVSYSLASKQAQRIEKFIENPDSASGIVTVPKTIASGETITIPTGRVAVLPNVQVDGTLNIEGDVFIPSGATFGDIENQIALKAPLLSPEFTGNPTAPTQTAGNNSTKLATTAYVDGKMVLGTVVNAAGTSVDFTGIPSWVKRITIMLNGVSTNGTSAPLLRVGTSSGIVSTGYTSDTVTVTGTGVSGSNTPIGVSLVSIGHTPSYLYNGDIVLELLSSNTWVITGILNIYTVAVCTCASKITLGANLDRLRITTVNGTDTFDAGSINIMYEG